MAAYYQIAGAAERSVSPSLVEGALAAMVAGAHHKRTGAMQIQQNANRPVSPSDQAQASGARLPSSACRGQLRPAPLAGLFLIPIVCALLSSRARRSQTPYSINCCAGSAAYTALVLIYVLPICATPPEFRCID